MVSFTSRAKASNISPPLSQAKVLTVAPGALVFLGPCTPLALSPALPLSQVPLSCEEPGAFLDSLLSHLNRPRHPQGQRMFHPLTRVLAMCCPLFLKSPGVLLASGPFPLLHYPPGISLAIQNFIELPWPITP